MNYLIEYLPYHFGIFTWQKLYYESIERALSDFNTLCDTGIPVKIEGLNDNAIKQLEKRSK